MIRVNSIGAPGNERDLIVYHKTLEITIVRLIVRIGRSRSILEKRGNQYE